MTALLTLPWATDDNGQSATYTLTLTPAARHRLTTFEAWLEPRLGPAGELGHIADWGGKLAGAVIRIAGLLHLAASAAEALPWTMPVGDETMANAITIGEYLIPHACAAFGEMGADGSVEDARHLLDWIERMEQTTFTKRDAFEGTKSRFRRAATSGCATDAAM